MFLCDFKNEVFVWIGENASPQEKQNGLSYAHVSIQECIHTILNLISALHSNVFKITGKKLVVEYPPNKGKF